ncbi:unnamed protein product [Prunus armeniaca]
MGFKAIACDMRKTYVGRFTGMPSRCSCCLKPKGSPRIHLQNQIQFIFPSSGVIFPCHFVDYCFSAFGIVLCFFIIQFISSVEVGR